MTGNKECSSTNFEIWSLIQYMVFLYMPISYLHPTLTLLTCHALVECCFLQKLRRWSQERLRKDDTYFRPSARTSWHNNSLLSITILPFALLPRISRSLFPSALKMTVFFSFSQLDWNEETSTEIPPTFERSLRAGPRQRSYKVAKGKHRSSQTDIQ